MDLNALTVGRAVTVHDDDGETPGRITYVGTHRDPVTGKVDMVSVSVRTDDGDDWAGIPIHNIEIH